MVVRATHTPLTLVLPTPHPTATCVTMPSGTASGAGVILCADVATVKAKPATAINLSINFSHAVQWTSCEVSVLIRTR